MSRLISEGGLRFEIPFKGSFTNQKPPYILNNVLSYRDRFDQYSLPRDVMKTIDRDIKKVKEYIRSKSQKVTDPKLNKEYFTVIRNYYTYEGPYHPGESMYSKFAPFIGAKRGMMVLKDLQRLKKELETAENKPEFED
jgi:hypothetical protein